MCLVPHVMGCHPIVGHISTSCVPFLHVGPTLCTRSDPTSRVPFLCLVPYLHDGSHLISCVPFMWLVTFLRNGSISNFLIVISKSCIPVPCYGHIDVWIYFYHPISHVSLSYFYARIPFLWIWLHSNIVSNSLCVRPNCCAKKARPIRWSHSHVFASIVKSCILFLRRRYHCYVMGSTPMCLAAFIRQVPFICRDPIHVGWVAILWSGANSYVLSPLLCYGSHSYMLGHMSMSCIQFLYSGSLPVLVSHSCVIGSIPMWYVPFLCVRSYFYVLSSLLCDWCHPYVLDPTLAWFTQYLCDRSPSFVMCSIPTWHVSFLCGSFHL